MDIKMDPNIYFPYQMMGKIAPDLEGLSVWLQVSCGFYKKVERYLTDLVKNLNLYKGEETRLPFKRSVQLLKKVIIDCKNKNNFRGKIRFEKSSWRYFPTTIDRYKDIFNLFENYKILDSTHYIGNDAYSIKNSSLNFGEQFPEIQKFSFQSFWSIKREPKKYNKIFINIVAQGNNFNKIHMDTTHSMGKLPSNGHKLNSYEFKDINLFKITELNVDKVMSSQFFKNKISIIPEFNEIVLNIHALEMDQISKERLGFLQPLIQGCSSGSISIKRIGGIKESDQLGYFKDATDLEIGYLEHEGLKTIKIENFLNLVSLKISVFASLKEKQTEDPFILYRNCPKWEFPPACFRIRTVGYNTGYGRQLFMTGSSSGGNKALHSHSGNICHQLDREWKTLLPLSCISENTWEIILATHQERVEPFELKLLLLDEDKLVHWQKGPNICVGNKQLDYTNELLLENFQFEEKGYPSTGGNI